MHKNKTRLRLRSETVRSLSTAELRSVAAGYQATGDACKSVDPCPGDFTWFCSP